MNLKPLPAASGAGINSNSPLALANTVIIYWT